MAKFFIFTKSQIFQNFSVKFHFFLQIYVVPIMYEWGKVEKVLWNKIGITSYSWTGCPETKEQKNSPSETISSHMVVVARCGTMKRKLKYLVKILCNITIWQPSFCQDNGAMVLLPLFFLCLARPLPLPLQPPALHIYKLEIFYDRNISLGIIRSETWAHSLASIKDFL